ncbi:Cytidylate kinase [Trichinella pseudospiralis]
MWVSGNKNRTLIYACSTLRAFKNCNRFKAQRETSHYSCCKQHPKASIYYSITNRLVGIVVYIDVQVIKWENIVIVRRPLCGPITLQVFVNAGDPPAASEAPASSLFLLFLSRADVSKPTPCRSPKSVAVTARVYTRSV